MDILQPGEKKSCKQVVLFLSSDIDRLMLSPKITLRLAPFWFSPNPITLKQSVTLRLTTESGDSLRVSHSHLITVNIKRLISTVID